MLSLQLAFITFRLERNSNLSEESHHILIRLKFSIAILLLVVIGGTFGFWFFEDNVTTLLDSFFFTLVTVTTIGYGNITPQAVAGKILDIAVILLGVGAALATIQSAFEVILRKRIREVLRLPKGKIDQKDHFIVCGYGKVGKAIVKRLQQENAKFIVIENDLSRVKELVHLDIPVIEGDSRQEEVLERAGARTAKFLLATMDDSYNVFVTLTAKMLNPSLRIISKIEEDTNEAKLKKSGADEVVYCHDMGAQMMINVAKKE